MRRLAIASRWNDILRALSGFGKRNKADASLRRRTFRFEPLEDRQLLSVCHWDGGGADNKWMTKENWVGDVAPVAGDSLYFEGTTRTATENDFTNGTSFAELCFTSSTAFSVSGNSITLPDLGIISAGCNSVSISANVAMGGMAGFQVDDDCALTMLGVLSDSGSTPGSIYKFVGGGVLTLAGANAFTGETEIEAGTLKIGNDAAIQNSSDVYVGNGTFDLNGHSVLADCLYCSESGKITSSVSGDVTLSIRTSTLGDSVCVGVIEDGLGRLSLVKVGTDTLFLGGANTYTGGTTITGGKVVINSDLALGQANGSGTFGDLTVNSGTTLDLNGHDVTVGSLRNSTSTGGIITDSTQTDGNSFVFVHQSPSVAYTGTFVNGSWTTGSGGSTTAHYRYVAPVRATGVDFFVAPADFVDPNDPTVGHGSDSNVGSWTQPWQTLRHVHDMTWSRASGIPAGGVLPNDHVYFRSGAYDVFADQNGDDAWWSITRGGAENHPIVLAACGSATVTWNTCYQLEWTWDTQRQCWSTSLAGAPMEGAAYWDSSSVFAVIKNSFRAMTMYSTATVRGIGSSSDNFYFTQESGCNDGTQLTGLYNGKPYYVDRLNWTNSPRYYLFWDGGNWRIAAHLSSADQDYWTLDVAGDPATPSLNVAFTHHGNASGSPMVTALDDPDDADGLPQDFVTPPQNQSVCLYFYNSQNQLLYDLIYCDPVSKVMYLKSNTVAPIATEDPNDPTSDPLVYVGGWQTYLCLNTGSSDLVFDGITFNWGSQLKTFAPRITFHDCTFLASTLYGSSCTGMKIASCYFDYLGGGEWHLDGATYDEGWWEQQLYLYGENMSFHDNFVGRNRSGGDIILWPENSNNVEVYNNVVYQSQIAVQNSGASGNIYNNVLFSVPKMVQDTPISAQHLYPAWYLCKGSAGQQFHNNYVEFANGSAVLSNWSNYIQSNVAVDDNVFVESRGQQPFIDTIVTTSYSSISNNTWIGHGCTGGGRMDGVLNTTNSETFVAYLNANHGTGNVFEQASQFLDVEAADRFLNTDPTLAAVMAYFRNYAARRSVTVSLDSLTPSSNDVLTATAKKLDIGNENNPDVTLTFVWKVNGIVKQTHVVSDPNVTDTFDLSVAGNGDIGDWITVEVTPRVDGVDGQTVTTNSAVVTAATRVWTGGGSDNKWSTAANWAGAVAPAPGDTLVFDNATGVVTQNDLPDSTTFSSLQFTGSGFSVSGNRLLLLRCLSVEGSATLSTDIALGPDSGFLVAGASQLTLSGVLSDSDGNSSILDLEGCGGTVTLTAANTYTGETYIDKCTVKIANDDAIEDSSDVWLACGTLDLNGHSIAIRALDQWGTITSSVAGNVTLAIGSGNQDSQGVIENGNGIVSVTKTGSNVLVLCGINTYTGRTTVQGGTLQLGLAAQSAILNGGGVDIQYGKVVFDYSGGSSPAAAILAALTTSYDANGPARFDTGKFISSVAETDYCGLAWKDNTAASQVTVVYSLYGDANLDGSVDSADQAVVTAHLYQNGNWSEGDFNYDGIVDDLDAAICESNVGNTVDAALLDLYS